MAEENKKKTKKEKTFMDKAIDIFIICIIVGAVFFVGALYMESRGKKQDSSKNNTPEKAGTETTKEAAKETEAAAETPLPEGVVRYDSCITASVLENDTTFYMLFDYNNNTYTEMVRAAQLEDVLDEGTFKETKNGLKTTSTKNDDLSETYFMNGDYIIPESAIFTGEIGEEDEFEAKCQQDSRDYKTTLSFFSNGTYAEEKKAKSKDINDISKGGTYKREDKFIERTSADGEVLLPLYIYEGQVANAYYKKVVDEETVKE